MPLTKSWGHGVPTYVNTIHGEYYAKTITKSFKT